MKKLLAISSVITMMAASSAVAKTEGNYVGIALNHTKASHQYKINGVVGTAFGKFDNTSTGYSLDYKHAFNFDGVFVATGVFYDKIGTMAIDKLGLGEFVSVRSRYGVKLDLGYDVTNNLGLYFTNGFAKVRSTIDWSGDDSGIEKDTSTLRYFYGAGASLKVSKSLSLNVEYNMQNLALKTPAAEVTARTKINMAKIGLSYNF